MIGPMPEEDGLCEILQSLSTNAWLARDASGRAVVLKRLPDDCLQRGQLHPNVKLRLQRLRELPLGAFVNILGVERCPHGVVMVTEYVNGTPLDHTEPLASARLLRELRLAVMSMHQLGLVHGAIKPGNVIVEPSGSIKLIDPSPLLHDDPDIDLRAIDALDSAAPKPTHATPTLVEIEPPHRQRTLIAAVALAVIAIGAAIAGALYLSNG